MPNQEIKCKVESCRYNNHSNNYCTLSDITVGTTGVASKNAHEKSDTECASFEME